MRRIGIPLAIIMTVIAVVMGGGQRFVNIPSAMICVFITLGLSSATSGWKGTFEALRSIRVLFSTPATPINDNVLTSLKTLIIYSYVSGITGWTIGNIQLLTNSREVSYSLMHGEAVCLITLFYSFVLSEFFLRPTIKRIQLLKTTTPRTQ